MQEIVADRLKQVRVEMPESTHNQIVKHQARAILDNRKLTFKESLLEVLQIGLKNLPK